MKTNDLYALQASGADMGFTTTSGIDGTSFRTIIGVKPNELPQTNALFPINLVLIVSLLIALCYGFYRREKWGAKSE